MADGGRKVNKAQQGSVQLTWSPLFHTLPLPLSVCCAETRRPPGTDDPSTTLFRPSSVCTSLLLTVGHAFVSTSIMAGHRSTYSNIDTEGPYQNGAYSSSQWLEKQQSSNRKSKFIVSLHIYRAYPRASSAASSPRPPPSISLPFRSGLFGLRLPPYIINSPRVYALPHMRRRSQVIGSVLALVVLIVAGVVIGVEVSKHNSSKKSGSSSSSSGEKTSSGNYAVGPYGVVQQPNPDDPSTFIKDDRLKQSFYGMAYTPENSQLPNCGNSLGTRSPRGLAARRRPPRVCPR